MTFAQAYNRFNVEQKAGVDHIEGSAIMVAGPGTGKTEVMAGRIASMVWSEAQIPAETILAMTYTEAGVKALRERLVRFLGVDAYRVHIHTFHSFCDKIIRSNPFQFRMLNAEPITDLEKEVMVRGILDDTPDDHPLRRWSGSVYYETTRLIKLFSMIKSEHMSPSKMIRDIEGYVEELKDNEEFQYKRNCKWGKKGQPNNNKIADETERMTRLISGIKLFDEFQERMIASERYDFDDMILRVIEEFDKSMDFLMRYQERYQYVMVDEFQDTNGAQLKLLRQLMSFWEVPNLFVVGDDDQSIYEFQGARIQNIVDYIQSYNPTIIVLKRNYRSGQEVIDASGKVIANNLDRLPARIDIDKSFIAAQGRTSSVTIMNHHDAIAEAAWVVHDIKTRIGAGQPEGEMAVIYRKHRQGDLILATLRAMGIPVNIIRSADALQSRVVQHIIHIMRYLVSAANTPDKFAGDKYKIMYMPWWGVSHQEVSAMIPLLKAGEEIEGSEEFHEVWDNIEALRQSSLVDPAYYVLTKIIAMLTPGVLRENDHPQLVKDIYSFAEWVKGEAKGGDVSMSEVLDLIDVQISNSISIPTINVNYNREGVNMVTTHGAKGLEFQVVYVIGVNANEWEKSRSGQGEFSLPPVITKSVSENQLESNRRLFYVGMTRAMDTLHVSYNDFDHITQKALVASQFVHEAEVPILQAPAPDPAMVQDIMLSQVKEIEFDTGASDAMIQDWISRYTMSATHLSQYLRCRVAFWFKYVVRVPLVPSAPLIYGTAMHVAMKYMYDSFKTGGWSGARDVIKVFLKSMDNSRGLLPADEYARRIVLGERSISAYVEQILPDTVKVTMNEFSAKNITIGGVPFSGDIDKIEFHGSDVDIGDYKTGSLAGIKKGIVPATQDNPNGGDYWRQIVTYFLIIDAMTWQGWKPRNGFIESLGPNPERIWVDVSDADKERVTKIIQATYHNISEGKFTPGCGECEWCKLIQ